MTADRKLRWLTAIVLIVTWGHGIAFGLLIARGQA